MKAQMLMRILQQVIDDDPQADVLVSVIDSRLDGSYAPIAAIQTHPKLESVSRPALVELQIPKGALGEP
jgi:hypothetical protein